MDPHHVLGVPPGASEAEIKAAYRRAALRWHPDRNAASDAAASATAATRFREASEAFERLTSAAGPRRAGAPGSGGPGHGSGAHRGGTRRGSSGASGYYNGADDPFGFRTAESARVGDHMRRVHRNIRVLYASLAALGCALYLAPDPPSPAEQAKARRRSEARARALGAPAPLRVVDRARPTLAPGSPLYGSGGGGGGGSADAYDDDVAAPRRRRRFEDAESAHDGTPTNHPDEATRYAYAYNGGFLDADAAEAFASSSSFVDGARPAAASDARRSGIPSNEGFAASPLSAAARRRAVRSSSRALPVAEGGGARYRSGRGGGGGDERDAAVRSRGGNTAGGTDTAGDGGAGPSWASGGFAGRGVSRRVLPYYADRVTRGSNAGMSGSRGGEDGAGAGEGGGFAGAGGESGTGGGSSSLTCARCAVALSPTARFCSICGARTVSARSVVVRRPVPDPQDTGSSHGRGRERHRALAKEEG